MTSSPGIGFFRKGFYTATICRLTICGLALCSLNLAGCTDQPVPRAVPARTPTAQYANGATGPTGYDSHVPDFATRNFEPFNRQDVAAIALREWRMFGAPVADDNPEDRPEASTPALKPERLPGLWQRIGEYWWIGQDPSETEVSWTGKTDADGQRFDPDHDAHFAWSAAFISYVMRVAGANDRFPYSPNHATYINAAAKEQSSGVSARAPGTYAPKTGDLICVGRGKSRSITFAMLPTQYGFPAHCGIVVATHQEAPPFHHELSIIGGNVDDSVAMTHVPTDASGQIADQSGQSYDTRYPWCAILEVHYDADQEPDSGR